MFINNKIALITGISGQDGSYLAELLLEKDYIVHGLIRRSSTPNTWRIDHLMNDQEIYNKKLFIHYGDVTDPICLERLIRNIFPDEIYHLAAQSHVKVSFEMPLYTTNTIVNSTLTILEVIKEIDHLKRIKFYHASSSEMFGEVLETPQKETTPFNPNSPYACAKVMGHNLTVNYRRGYDLFACNGILFNHESFRRGETFVTRKIIKGLVDIIKGRKQKLYLGNLDAKRDWGHAKDYVEGMYLMLQQQQPDDYVLATGETHTVREFLNEAFKLANLDWQNYVVIDPKYFRPSEVDLLLGDATKAKEKLGWEPRIKFKQLVKLMYEEEMKRG
jgi:GDPmannose 4,6-dehydratase